MNFKLYEGLSKIILIASKLKGLAATEARKRCNSVKLAAHKPH